ncbi:MAG: monovalent cation/H+ antiporter subunit D family protein [Candidatus Omnitrophica bacterium]|nr:monovalent cation/H+ antiporter subunit D family protein [Candidatus Omnitrophota bacterium]
MTNLSLFILIPLAAAFLIPVVSRKLKWFPDVCGIFTTLLLLLLSLQTMNQETVYAMGNWPAPYGIVFVLDGFSCLLLIIINLVGFVSTLFSFEYIEYFYTSKLRYYSLFLLMLAGMNGVVLTGDLFNLFVFLEIASIASYALVGFGCQSRELEASFKYLVMSTVASSFILLAIALVYGRFGSLNIAHIALLIKQHGMNDTIIFSFVLLLVGFGVKSAIVPFHAWLPDAHPSAPAPISAMLSGVVIKALGVYAIVRLVYNLFGMTALISNLLIYSGIISMIIGVLLALGQWDFKRLLAYHSISQMGYIFLGFGLGTPLGILGGAFHLFNHSLFKSLLFLNSGSVEYETGTRNLEKLGDLVQKMPVTAFSSLIASLSISGIPPFNGFWSKLIIIIAAVQAGKPVVALWAVIGSILTLASFSKIQRYVFFGHGKNFDQNSFKAINEVPLLMKMSMIILAILCTFTGLLMINGVNGIFGPVVNVLDAGPHTYIEKILKSNFFIPGN